MHRRCPVQPRHGAIVVRAGAAVRLVLAALLAIGASAVGCAEGSTTDQPPTSTGSGAGTGTGSGSGGSGASGASTGSGATGTGTATGGGDCVADPPYGEGTQCATAIHLGQLNDAAGDETTVTGNSPQAGRTIWWSFQATDDTDTNGDEFHVDVRFVTNPGDGYEMAVYRGGCEPDDEIANGETDVFDWYVDFPMTSLNCTVIAPCGAGDCNDVADDPSHNTCEDDSATFYVALTHTDGQASCDDFELELSNGKYETTP